MKRSLPPLSALRAFEATARLGSAARAAQELSVTPTAISHQLRTLEDALAVRLFVRRPRQLLLTAEGAALRDTLVEAFDAIAQAVGRLRKRARRRIVLSTTPAVTARWLVPHIAAWQAAHDDLDLHIAITHTPVMLDGVDADMAIRYGAGQWPGLVAEKLFDNLFAPLCSPRLKLRKAGDLVGQTLLHFAPPGEAGRPMSWHAWQASAQVPGLDVDAGPVFTDETHVIAAAREGHGIALMSLPLVADDLRAGVLVQPFGPALPGQPFHLVFPEARRDDADIQAVRGWILSLPRPQAIESMGAAGRALQG